MKRIGLGLAILFAAGCAPAARPPQEVVFWQFAEPAALEPVVRRFESENPGLRVRLVRVAPAALAESLDAALALGAPPDLCELDGDSMRAYLDSGELSDWSAGVADQRDSLLGWEACRVGVALYGMPWRLSPRVLYWNRDLFARAGLPPARPPATWDALVAAARRIERLGGGVHGYGLPSTDTLAMVPEFLSLAWTNGGELLSAAGDSVRLDSPANEQALELGVRLGRVGLQADSDFLDREFAAGRLGLRIAGSRLATWLDHEAPELKYGLAPLPARAAADSVVPFADVSVLASFTRSRHKEHALRLARYLARPENSLEIYAAAAGGVPANSGADTLAWFRSHPRDEVLASQAARSRFAPAVPGWRRMEHALGDELIRALRGEQSPDSALAHASARLAAIVGRR